MHELDTEAWERWLAYRKAIKKAIKPVSEPAMKLKLQRFGTDQAAVVEQSISNQWTGLFELKRATVSPGEKPKKTSEQVAADNMRWEADQHRAIKGWDEDLEEALGRLKLCDALWARYNVTADADTPSRKEWLRGVIAEEIRRVDPAVILGEPPLRSLVREVFGEKGVMRLKARAGV